MNNNNLIPQAHKLTLEDQIKGGTISGEVKRERKQLKDLLTDLLDKQVNAEQLQELEKNNVSDTTNRGLMVYELFKKAISGNTRAFELIRSTLGEDPKQLFQLELTRPEETTINIGLIGEEEEAEKSVYNSLIAISIVLKEKFPDILIDMIIENKEQIKNTYKQINSGANSNDYSEEEMQKIIEITTKYYK